MRLGIAITAILLCISSGYTQQKYWVYFTDKAQSDYNPLDYLNADAVMRRTLNGFPIDHPSDYPVNTSYIEEVAALSHSLGSSSRWLNAQAVYATDDQLKSISELSYVKAIRPIRSQGRLAENSAPQAVIGDNYLLSLMYKQLSVMEADLFAADSIDGTGVKVAVFDAGFPGVENHEAFAHIRYDNRIIQTYDFIKNTPFVYHKHSHGTMVLSNIGGLNGNIPLGAATGATFLLARTEGPGEPRQEEDRWIAALEWAEKLGAQVVNSSLGYSWTRYMEEDMDGRTAPISKAANMAAAKGVLVVNAAGNEGTNWWKTVIAPADADSVLTVGGIDPNENMHIDFGSYGPTADKRLKPNLSHYGQTAAVSPTGGYEAVFGTSFASPLTAGFAACVIQMNPTKPVMDIFKSIERSGHLYPYYDYAHGYGLPQAGYFFEENSALPDTTFTYAIDTEKITVTGNAERPDNGSVNRYIGENHLYIHIENDQGYLSQYKVVELLPGKRYTMRFDENLEEPKRIRVYYNGFTQTVEL